MLQRLSEPERNRVIAMTTATAPIIQGFMDNLFQGLTQQEKTPATQNQLQRLEKVEKVP